MPLMLGKVFIRVTGNQWVESSDARFDYTIDMRGAFILLVNRAVNAIVDDLPKGFELKDGELQASTPINIPNDTLREAIVNAFMHRSFRVNRPIQIIRYSNRIEINNPGFSLKSPEHLGEPGSELRNPFISAIFHDTNLAETKGTGIKSMRDQMKAAHLMPPTFESSRETNVFTLRLLLHHLLGEEDVKWLARFANFDLSNEQRLSLIFMRELGAIDNITYRQLNSDINTRRASLDLHRMCEMGLFELRGQGRNSYYVAGREFVLLNARDKVEISRGEREISREEGKISRDGVEISRDEEFPEKIRNKISKLKKWSPSSEMESLIMELCSIKPLSLSEISSLLGRKPVSIRYQYIIPLLKQGVLFYTIPEMLNHPNQKYTTKKKINT